MIFSKNILRMLGILRRPQKFHELVAAAGGVGCIVEDKDGLQWTVNSPDWSGLFCLPYPHVEDGRRPLTIRYNSTGYKLIKRAE